MTALHYEIGTHRQFNDKPQRLIVHTNPVPGDPRRVVIRAPTVHLLGRDAALSVAVAILAALDHNP